VRHALAFFFFRVGVGLIGQLGGRIAIRLGRLGAGVFYLLASGRREMAKRHGMRLGAEDPVSHARKVFAGYGRYWAEAFWIRPRRLPALRETTVIDGIEHVREAKRAGRGLIFAVPHVGNWEIAGPVAIEEEIELVAVAENLANKRIRDWFVQLRNRLGIGIVLATGGVMRELEVVLRRNGAVALLCDRDLNGRGVKVRFFGEDTTLPAGPVSLALRTRAPILPVAVYFREGIGHELVIRPPLELSPTGERKRDLATGTQRVADALEELITAAPDQWHLLQPNWPSDRQLGP